MKGTCEKHGEFVLTEGCLKCLAEGQEKDGKIIGTTEHSTGIGEHVSIQGQPSTTAAEEPSTETAVALRPGEDIEVRGYYSEAQKVLAFAKTRVIATLEDSKKATDDLSIISKLKKAMEGKKREYLDPLKAQVDAIRDTYNYLMAPVLEADKITREKMMAYRLEQELLRQKQEEINRKRQEAAEAEMELKGELSEPVNLVEVAPEAPKKISTEMGTAGQRMIRKWELVDMAQVPEEYKALDSAKITKVVKAGIPSIPGIRIYEEPIITVRAK